MNLGQLEGACVGGRKATGQFDELRITGVYEKRKKGWSEKLQPL